MAESVVGLFSLMGLHFGAARALAFVPPEFIAALTFSPPCPSTPPSQFSSGSGH